jgi:hypothetical protein
MPTIERGIPLVEHVIGELRARVAKLGGPTPIGAGSTPGGRAALDALESRLMVELPPTLRTFLAFDFTFSSLDTVGTLHERRSGARAPAAPPAKKIKWHGLARFGTNPQKPKARLTSIRKLAEARTDLGWTDSRIRTKVVRLPNRPRHPWNALYLGEARRDGELVILGIDHEETNVRVYPRYTAFDLYLAEQTGLLDLSDSQRLEDLESHLALNPELGSHEDIEDGEPEY